MSAAAHRVFLGGKQQRRAFKEAEECFGSPFLPYIQAHDDLLRSTLMLPFSQEMKCVWRYLSTYR